MIIDRAAIAETEKAIRPYIRLTPTLDVEGGDLGVAVARLTMKLEQTQHAGSFKARGAFANLLLRAVPREGVVAASGGNHGVAVAFAAQRLKIPAKIFVPTVASPAKIAAIRALGADLVVGGDRYADALAASEAWIAKTGALPVHAYEQRETMLGQGTVGAELERQTPDLDTLLVAVGGGGLIGGIAAWYENRVRVVAVEPDGAPTLAMALKAGQPIDAPTGSIAADSLAPRQVGQLMFPIAQKFVDRAVLVSDDAIRAAQKSLWRNVRLVAEPGAAVALAALQSGAYKPAAKERVGVLVCGANTDAVKFD